MRDFNLLMERYINKPYTFSADGNTISVKIIYDPILPVHDGHRLLVMRGDKIIMNGWFYDPYTFRTHQYKFWSIFDQSMLNHYKSLGVISDYTIRVLYTLFFFPPIVKQRTEWDITTKDEETIKEHCITSGDWTDVVYNFDGSFTHTPTKEEDIPQIEICG